MSTNETEPQTPPVPQRQQSVEQFWAGDLSRKLYLLRRQRKAILESCRRIAVVGASSDPNSPSFVTIEKLLGLGLEIIPIFAERESLLGLRCYARLVDFPGKIDIVQVYPDADVDLRRLAQEAVTKTVATFWIEQGRAASTEVADILGNGHVQLVEYESLFGEYIKHTPVHVVPAQSRRERKGSKVRERMTRNPAMVKPNDALKDAIWKMEHGHFRHLPVVDDSDKLIGMLSDRDVRLIRPSLAFVGKEDAMVQLWSLTVQDAAVFDPVKVKQDTSLKEAAELMLRWHVGGLPVVDEHDKPVGMITYTDLLREFIGCEDTH